MMFTVLIPGGTHTLRPGDVMRVPAGGQKVLQASGDHVMYCLVDSHTNLPVTRVQLSSQGTLRLFWKGGLKYTFPADSWSSAITTCRFDTA